MSTIELGDLPVRAIGQQVTIHSRGTSITGQLTDFRTETAWITTQTMAQSADDWEQVPGRRSMTVAVGQWRAEGLPLNTPVEVDW